LISRRTALLGALATVAAACTSSRGNQVDGGGIIEVQTGETVSLGEIQSKPKPPKEKVPTSIVMVGDSITALSEATLKTVLADVGFDSVTINAEPRRRIEVGSKPTPGLPVVTYIAATDPPPEMWVIALGTNDAGLYATNEQYQELIDDVLKVIPASAPLVWVSTYRADLLSGCEQFNLLMRAALQKRGNATVGEWYDQCAKSAKTILTRDGVHPNANGILVFADTVRQAVVSQIA
jgi:lysophospholipase L1-like esterase